MTDLCNYDNFMLPSEWSDEYMNKIKSIFVGLFLGALAGTLFFWTKEKLNPIC